MPVVDRPRLQDPFYYLNNFHILLETLQRRDGDLLQSEEVQFIADFSRLPTPARALLVRMVMRKGALFRSSRLCYPEIGGVDEALQPLVALGWVTDRPPLTLEELFRLFRTVEIAQVLERGEGEPTLTKGAWLAQLREALPESLRFTDFSGISERVVRLEVDALCDRLRLMFFGNFRQELTEFVLADLGIVRYERVELQTQSRPFRTRAQVAAFHQLYLCREMLHAGVEGPAIERALPPAIADCEWLEERREKLRFHIARAYERAGAIEAALRIYATCAHPEAPARAARWRLGPSGLTKQRLSRAASRVPRFDLALEPSAEPRPVEVRVLDHLVAAANDDTAVYYVENTLINALFGLLCWSAVFAPLPGAFFHPFHHGPADLSSAGFFARRQREFAACFSELTGGTYRRTIRRNFADKHGIASPFVAWELLDERLLLTALDCFPADHLALWFDWIARDVRANRAGFPDLVQFWPRRGEYRLVEVKGPGDRLQDNQRRTLEFCLAQHMPVSVCHVRWA